MDRRQAIKTIGTGLTVSVVPQVWPWWVSQSIVDERHTVNSKHRRVYHIHTDDHDEVDISVNVPGQHIPETVYPLLEVKDPEGHVVVDKGPSDPIEITLNMNVPGEWEFSVINPANFQQSTYEILIEDA